MEKIESKDNAKIKLLRKLGQKKYRDELALFVVENLKTIQDAGSAPKMLFGTDKKLLEKLEAREKYLISGEINKSFSSLDTPSGVAAVYPIFLSSRASEASRGISHFDMGKNIVYLNGISDPGNIGTILRTALAFDIKNIVVDEDCADIHNPKAIQAAKDSIFKLNIAKDKNFKFLKEIKKKMPVISARLLGGKGPEKFKNKKVCIVLGSESHGVDKRIQKISNDFIKIKISKDMESLNVAIAAGIIFYSI
ncbi:RNA methyltransferase [Candidatus Parcubacteria bacterium]|nr:RNA methyltransferase [Patescibacteria group bacterium]MCG2693672.1 RNA methyltransferase [Candidatus Parcubacteria bacterium]